MASGDPHSEHVHVTYVPENTGTYNIAWDSGNTGWTNVSAEWNKPLDWNQIQAIPGTGLEGLAEQVKVIVCMVCAERENDEAGFVEVQGLCELCRQAILKFRAMVLEDMARDLEKMMSD